VDRVSAPAPVRDARRDVLEAREADSRARDRIARAIDQLLAEAPFMRFVGARLLTRPLARSSRSTAQAIAAELRLHRSTLQRRIRSTGGESLKRFRDELFLVRLAGIMEHSRIPWPCAAEVLGAPRAEPLFAIIRSRAELPPGLWRQRVTANAQLFAFMRFLAANAPAWATLPAPPRRLGPTSKQVDSSRTGAAP
jgi:AraC-like DNA-binding protein